EEARRRGTQKTVLERKAPPTFGVLIEIQDKNSLAVHHDVAEVVDRFLRDIPPRPELRTRKEDGQVEISRPERKAAEQRTAPERSRPSGRPRNGNGRPGPGRDMRDMRNITPWAQADPDLAPITFAEDDEAPAPPPKALRGKPVRIFPYAVSKAKLERALRKFRVSAYLVDDLDNADMVVTIKSQERRQPRRLRDAHARGVPFYVVRSNTIVQMENFLRGVFKVDEADGGDDEALQEVEDAIDEVLDQGHPVELPPRNNHLRRLQHQIIERYGLTSESKGEEPYRRVVIYPAGERLSSSQTPSAM
ncbi:MAG TPA: R3H domain-containing nucleic acid-binding protein, partial [Thermoanaerobaculia bacterium]|nr:R3H domain-containing nucleic acid-binding protein [Thermoanaerobaculia bacterium]